MSLRDLIPKLALMRAGETFKRQGFNGTALGHWKQASEGIIKFWPLPQNILFLLPYNEANFSIAWLSHMHILWCAKATVSIGWNLWKENQSNPFLFIRWLSQVCYNSKELTNAHIYTKGSRPCDHVLWNNESSPLSCSSYYFPPLQSKHWSNTTN